MVLRINQYGVKLDVERKNHATVRAGFGVVEEMCTD
jgi:hypothetical protein